jgi:hypothetical protein
MDNENLPSPLPIYHKNINIKTYTIFILEDHTSIDGAQNKFLHLLFKSDPLCFSFPTIYPPPSPTYTHRGRMCVTWKSRNDLWSLSEGRGVLSHGCLKTRRELKESSGNPQPCFFFLHRNNSRWVKMGTEKEWKKTKSIGYLRMSYARVSLCGILNTSSFLTFVRSHTLSFVSTDHLLFIVHDLYSFNLIPLCKAYILTYCMVQSPSWEANRF